MTSIIDVTGVLGMPLKLVAIKSFKSNNRKIMSKQQKSSKTIFQGATFLGEVFPVGNFPKPYFCGVIFRGQSSRGLFAGGDFFLGGIFPDTTVQSFLK